MTSAKLETINGYVAKLHGYAYFRPEEGALRERLTQVVLDDVDGELAEELSEGEFGLEVSIGRQEEDNELGLSISVDRPGVVHSSQLAINLLGDNELDDLARYLEPLLEEAAPAEAEATVAGKTILRKTSDTAGQHEKEAAAARLKVTPEWLKSVIPCTDYSYEEIDGKKYIREYYWSKELIERLFKIKCSKTSPEDLQYVATECCEGDVDWARDLIARLKSPNRPEPAPKEQPQKGQGRPSQQKGAQQKAQAKPAAGKQGPANAPAKPAQAKQPAAPNAAPGTAAAPAGGNQRNRSRSRHRKPFRQQGKDGAQKPQSGGEQKQPPQQ